MADQIGAALKILRRKELETRLGLSRSTIYAKVANSDLPPPIRLGKGRAVGWLESDISNWLDIQIKRSRKIMD